jgi:hypothetical protein
MQAHQVREEQQGPQKLVYEMGKPDHDIGETEDSRIAWLTVEWRQLRV